MSRNKRSMRGLQALLALGLFSGLVAGPGCSANTDVVFSLDMKFTLETTEEGLIVIVDGATIVLRTTGDGALHGLVDVDAEGLAIARDAVLTVDDNSGALIGSFVLSVTDTIRVFADSDFPTTGEFDLTAEDAFEGRVTVTVDNSIPGVRIDFDPENDGTTNTTQSLSWSEFEELADSGDRLLRRRRRGQDPLLHRARRHRHRCANPRRIRQTADGLRRSRRHQALQSLLATALGLDRGQPRRDHHYLLLQSPSTPLKVRAKLLESERD